MSSLVINGDTSGSVTIAAPAVAGSSTITLPTTGGTMLTTKSTGAVLQVVTNTISSSLTTSSTSVVASTLITTITPSSSTSKIFVLLNGGGIDSNTANNTQVTYMYRNIASAGYSLLSQMEVFFFPSGNAYGGHSFNYLDSPATTSSISYQPYYKVAGGSGSVWFNNNSGVISLTLMEIAA